MRLLLYRARTLLGVNYALMTEYRAELCLWVLGGIMPFIMMGVWMQASQGGSFGLNEVDFARYFLVTFIVRQLTVMWVIWEFEYHVVEGKLSPFLLQPMDPAWRLLAAHLSEQLARLPFWVLLVGLFFYLYPQAWWVPSGHGVLLFIPALVLTYALRFLIQYTFAMLCFWLERASAIETLWFMPYMFLSGMAVPLSLFPETVRTVVMWTPFPYMVYVPVQMLLNPGQVNVPLSFAVMGLWIVGFWLLNRWLWRLGLRQYSGMGA